MSISYEQNFNSFMFKFSTILEENFISSYDTNRINVPILQDAFYASAKFSPIKRYILLSLIIYHTLSVLTIQKT